MTLAPRNRVDALFFVLILLMIDQCRMSGDMSCALCGCPRERLKHEELSFAQFSPEFAQPLCLSVSHIEARSRGAAAMPSHDGTHTLISLPGNHGP